MLAKHNFYQYNVLTINTKKGIIMDKAILHKDMGIDEYHSHKDIISKSMLSDFADCPARFKHSYIDGNDTKKNKITAHG